MNFQRRRYRKETHSIFARLFQLLLDLRHFFKKNRKGAFWKQIIKSVWFYVGIYFTFMSLAGLEASSGFFWGEFIVSFQSKHHCLFFFFLLSSLDHLTPPFTSPHGKYPRAKKQSMVKLEHFLPGMWLLWRLEVGRVSGQGLSWVRCHRSGCIWLVQGCGWMLCLVTPRMLCRWGHWTSHNWDLWLSKWSNH